MRYKKSLLLSRNPKVQSRELVLLSLVTASACQKTEDMTGAVIKGPLKNATVFLDYDDDGWEDWDGVSYPFPNWREEVANTNPWNPDTDGDSMTDGYEADNG